MALRIAIIGATGLVGRKLLSIMETKGINPESLGLYASEASEGKGVGYRGMMLTVSGMSRCNFSEYRAAFFCVGDELSARYVPHAMEAGCVVVDKSNTYRMADDVPLIVPGVNSRAIPSGCKLVANPNCTTIVLTHALRGLHQEIGLKKVWAATYQSITGAGKAQAEDLLNDLAASKISSKAEFASLGKPESLAFNVLGQIGSVDETRRCSEETKLVRETQKILGAPDLAVMAHSVRVPVMVGHSIAVTVELSQPATMGKVQGTWETNPNIRFMEKVLPTPISASKHDQVEVGRLRREPQLENGYSFFVCGDNLNLGAALNGWRILNLMQEMGTVPQFNSPSGASNG